MNRTYTNILVAALSFSAPKMEDYRQAWSQSDQTEAEAEMMIKEIKADFKRLDSTDHAGMAKLMGVPHVTYRTPNLNSAANTGAQLQYVKG